MAKYAFTVAGAASKLSELYALSDPALAAEAAAIKADFKDWMGDNFTFTTPQSTFLSGMDTRATDYYGQLCSTCFLFRLDIDLVYPGPPPGAIGKYIESEDKNKMKSNGSGGMSATGSVTFTVGYEV